MQIWKWGGWAQLQPRICQVGPQRAFATPALSCVPTLVGVYIAIDVSGGNHLFAAALDRTSAARRPSAANRALSRAVAVGGVCC